MMMGDDRCSPNGVNAVAPHDFPRGVTPAGHTARNEPSVSMPRHTGPPLSSFASNMVSLGWVPL